MFQDRCLRRSTATRGQMTVESRALPDAALHASYARRGAYTDCFTADVPEPASLAEFVEAFYTSRVFKLERRILGWAGKPSTDAEARELAAGARDRFAAWTLEGRTTDQILMCDYLGHTRSWLMVASSPGNPPGATRLHFGSVVVPVRRFPYNVLIGFHRLYSRILLKSAIARLARLRRPD